MGAIPQMQEKAQVAAILLAAGTASRMGDAGHKLLAEFDGTPLVRRAAQAALSSKACVVTVVTGHRHAEIEAALAGLGLAFVHNPRFSEGMATSLSAGLRLPHSLAVEGVVVLLADMPHIDAGHIDLLIDAFRAHDAKAVVRAAFGKRPGNPVVIPRPLYAAVMTLRGDRGARGLIEGSGIEIVDVEIGRASQTDVDTPDAILAEGGSLKG